MTKEERSAKLHELSSKIRELKLRGNISNIRTKKTIQKLQQEMDNLPEV
jgi:hypothetical protein